MTDTTTCTCTHKSHGDTPCYNPPHDGAVQISPPSYAPDPERPGQVLTVAEGVYVEATGELAGHCYPCLNDCDQPEPEEDPEADQQVADQA